MQFSIGKYKTYDAFNLNVVLKIKRLRISWYEKPASFGIFGEWSKTYKGIVFQLYKVGIEIKFNVIG